jgi:uncharacterized protein
VRQETIGGVRVQGQQEQVGILLELMDVDERIRSLKRRVEAHAAEKQRKTIEVQLVSTGLAQEQDRLAGAEKRRRDAAREVEVSRTRKRDSESKLQSVKTNDEYRALLKEIEAAKGSMKRWEEAIAHALEEEEAAKRTGATVAGELQLKETAAHEETTRFEQDLSAARLEQRELISQRRELITRLSAPVRNKYERLWSSKGDTAIVRVQLGSCGGCHYNLPPQTVNEVRAGQRLMLCEGCGRILVWTQP